MTLGCRPLDPHDPAMVAGWLAVMAAGATDTPADPQPCPLDLTGSLRFPPPGIDLADWVLCRDGEVAATLRLAFDANAPGARVDRLLVHPRHRRAGLGRTLVALARARARGRVELTAVLPESAVPLARAVGAEPLADDYLRMRIDLGAGEPVRPLPASPGYALLAWHDQAPDEHVVAAAWLERTLGEDGVTPPPEPPRTSYLRRLEHMRAGRGRHAHHVGAVHEPTGALVGYTNITTVTASPDFLFQGMTVVHRAHRGHRLGRSLKETNLANALAANPTARVLETTNSASNEAITALNTALGYQVHSRLTTWRLPVDR